MNVILDMSLIVVFIAFLLYCNATRQITFNISKGSTVKTDICGLAKTTHLVHANQVLYE